MGSDKPKRQAAGIRDKKIKKQYNRRLTQKQKKDLKRIKRNRMMTGYAMDDEL